MILTKSQKEREEKQFRQRMIDNYTSLAKKPL